MAPSWARSTVWLVAANVLRNLGLLAVLLALGQLTDPATVGRYALALALTSPIFVFAQLGLKGVYLTLRTSHRFSTFLAVQIGAVVLAFTASVVVALVVNPALVSTVALVSFVKSVDCGFELGSGALQRYHHTPTVFWSYLTAAILGIVAVVAVLLASAELDLALAALGTVNGVVATVSTVRLGLRLARRHEVLVPHPPMRVSVVGILKAGLPTGAAAAVLALVASLPQYFLASSWGEATVGHFAVLLYLVAIADIFGGTLTQAWIPGARARLEERTSGFVGFTLASTLRWTAIFLPLTVAGLWIASAVLPVLMSPEYTIGFDLALPLAVAIMLLPLLHFGGTAISVLNLYIHNITLSVVAAGVSVLACLVLAAPFGLVGALWATVLAYLARATVALAILVTQGRQGTPTTTHPR